MARKLTRVLSKDNMLGDQVCRNYLWWCDIENFIQWWFTNNKISVDQYATTYKGISLRGFERETHLYLMVLRLSKIKFWIWLQKELLYLNLLNKAFDFRYLVDAFGLGLTEDLTTTVDICIERD
jgi:hypothetical protein